MLVVLLPIGGLVAPEFPGQHQVWTEISALHFVQANCSLERRVPLVFGLRVIF